MGKFVFAFLVFFSALPSNALVLENYGLGYGLLSSGILSESVTPNGQPSIYGSFTFHFLSAHIRWSGNHYKYGLRLGYTLLPRETADDAAKITQLIFSPQFGVPLGATRRWLWNTSVGLLYTESKGQGGSVVGANGGSTATFYRPSDTVSSLLINLETGVNWQFSSHWFASWDLIFNGLLGDKRSMGLFMTIGYSWGSGTYSAFSGNSGSYPVRGGGQR